MHKIDSYDSFFHMCEEELEKYPDMGLKSWEVAIQDTIKKIFPNKQWYNVTHVSIFAELLSGKTPNEVCQLIWKDIEKALDAEKVNHQGNKLDERIFEASKKQKDKCDIKQNRPKNDVSHNL